VVSGCGHVFKGPIPEEGGECGLEKKSRWLDFQFEEEDENKRSGGKELNPHKIKIKEYEDHERRKPNSNILIEDHFHETETSIIESQRQSKEEEKFPSKKQSIGLNEDDEVDLDDWYLVE
jgi:hypothetical protein